MKRREKNRRGKKGGKLQKKKNGEKGLKNASFRVINSNNFRRPPAPVVVHHIPNFLQYKYTDIPTATLHELELGKGFCCIPKAPRSFAMNDKTCKNFIDDKLISLLLLYQSFTVCWLHF